MTGQDLTTFLNKARLPAVTDEQLAAALTQSIDDAGGVTNAGITFLDFSGKLGVYKFGRDKEDVDENRMFLVEPAAALEGWVCWKDGEAVSKHKWLATDAYQRPEIVVRERDLKDMGPYRKNSGDGWKKMRGIGLMELTDMTTSIEYTTTAVSAINGLLDLLDEAAERLPKGEPSLPIIWLGRTEFTAQGSTNWKPVFNVEMWVTRDAVAAFMEGKLTEDQLIAGEAPKKRRAPAKKKAAPKAARGRK